MAFASVPTENNLSTHVERTCRLYLENPVFVDVQYSDADFYPLYSLDRAS
jgi:hypothetical protein